MTLLRRLVLVLILVLLSISSHAGKRRAPALRQDVDLPPDFAVDFQLGRQQRAELPANSVDLPQAYAAGGQVFGDLVGSPIIQNLGLPYAWSAQVVDAGSINAYSLSDGRIFIDRQLAALLGDSAGLWAAVLSHEVAHTGRRHWVKKFLYALYIEQQAAYYKARAAAGDDSANWALLGLRIGAAIASKKLSRDLEHDADAQGMMLMARAGYHPDNVFAMHHLLRLIGGDQSKLGAFFSSHPRWQTRDERSQKVYDDALRAFQEIWPDAVQSPGGPPPIVAFIGKPQSTENKQTLTADIQVPLYCRNASGPVSLTMRFRKDQRPVKALDSRYSDQNGDLLVLKDADCPTSPTGYVLLQLPAELVAPPDRKLKARLEVFSTSRMPIEATSVFKVQFPKVKRSK